MAAPSGDIRNRWHELDWEHILPRLMLYAERVLGRKLRAVRGGPQPEDVVQSTVAKVLDGRRSLPDPEEVAPFVALCHILWSEANNALRRFERRRTESLDEATVGRASLDPAVLASPEEAGLSGTLARRIILTRLADDPRLMRLMDLLWESPELKPRDLAQLLGVSSSDVYKDMRRLRYRLRAVESELGRVIRGS